MTRSRFLKSRRALRSVLASALLGIATLGMTGATMVTRPTAAAASSSPSVPRFSHVIEVFLENDSATDTWEGASAPHLAGLKAANTYIPQFYGVGHASLDNYEAAFGAVEPTAQGKADCAGQPYGSCVFPASVPTIGALLDDAGLPWKVYSEGMAGAPLGGPCLHAVDRNAPDFYQGPGTNGYATRHNPAPWFDSILTNGGSEDYCRAHSVDLANFFNDLQHPAGLPAFSFIEPDTCHDGHDTQALGGCALDPEGPGYPAGVAAMDAWLPDFVDKVTHAPAWDDHSVLFITLDEGSATDTSGCQPCHDGSAGGRIGAVVVSPMLSAGKVSNWNGDHYGFLRTLETAWGLPTLASKAKDQVAAAAVHDGDAGVVPLTDVWRVPNVVTAASAPSAGSTSAAMAAPPEVPIATGAARLPATGRRMPLAAAGLCLVAALAAGWLRRRTRNGRARTKQV